MRRERNERTYGMSTDTVYPAMSSRDPNKDKHKLVFAIFLLVILIIVLLYAIVNMNKRFSEDLTALNEKVVDLSSKKPESTPPSAPIPVEAPKPTVIYRYICQDGREVEFAEDCTKNVVLAPIDIQPIKTRELNTRITNVTITPTCVSGYDGGKMYYDASLKPSNVSVEVKDILSKESYHFAQVFNSETQKYRLFAICDEGEQKCPSEGDFSVKKNKYYFLRLAFNYGTIDKIEYSNEYVVDTREGSSFTSPVCRS